MAWNQYSWRAPSGRAVRDAVRRYRAADEVLQAGRGDSSTELQRYDAYLALLVSVHVDCGEAWDWDHVALESPPVEPAHAHDAEHVARAELAAHRPGLLARFGRTAARRRAELEDRLGHAMAVDRKLYEVALARHRAAHRRWSDATRLAPGVLALDRAACGDALRLVGAFDEIAAYKTHVSLDALGDRIATLSCVIRDPDLVPSEELTLTPAGALARRAMASTKYWALYRDHVCACAVRIAREVFAALPIDGALINVIAERLDGTCGLMRPDPVLGVHFTRAALGELDVVALAPADCIGHFPYWMKFKRRLERGLVDDALLS